MWSVDEISSLQISEMYFSELEIRTKLETLNVIKAKGPDDLRNLPFKNTQCLDKSPKLVFKAGSIVPLFKDGHKQSVANYRLETLLNSISKVSIFENCILPLQLR